MTENSKRLGFVNRYRNIKASWRLSDNSIPICFLGIVWKKVLNWKWSQENSMMVSSSRSFKLYLKHTAKLKLIYIQTISELIASNPNMIKRTNLAGGCALTKIVNIRSYRLKRGFYKWWIRWDQTQVRKGY